MTRSPFLSPRDFSTFANLQVSIWSWLYVSTRWSPGSPSQMSAALFLRQVVKWRSWQLTEAFVFPPMNHFANGAFHSKVFFQGLDQQSRVLAWSAQNFSGFFAAAL